MGRIDPKMRACLIGFGLAALVAGALQARQDPAAAGFPGQLLDGPENFELALHLHGDARGNVGPCG